MEIREKRILLVNKCMTWQRAGTSQRPSQLLLWRKHVNKFYQHCAAFKIDNTLVYLLLS